MFRKTFLFCLLIVLLYIPELYPQYNNNISQNAAPFMPQTYFANAYNPYSRGFAYTIVGNLNANSQLFKFDVGNPGSTTEIGTPPLAIFSNGDFANPDGVWKFYVLDQYTEPYHIYEVDTATGAVTDLGALVNLKPTHKPRDLEWDQTTNTWYLVSQSWTLNEVQFYSMYWPTKELTWIGPGVSPPVNIHAGGFNINGTYFGIDISNCSLWKVDKYTGTWTLVGPLNAYSNNHQDAAFDRSNYSRLLWSVWGPGRFYEVDTATANATLIGNFPYNDNLIFGLGIAPYFGPQIKHTPLQNTGNLSGPYTINAYAVSNNTGISGVKLFWSRNNSVVTDSLNMTNAGGNNWTGSIPGNGLPAAYRYCIRANDSLGRSAAVPYRAPDSLYRFNAMGQDTIKPMITHTPHGNLDIMLWPDTLRAVVTDNNGIDSVWVRYKTNNGAEKFFKLTNTSGNNFSARFNSTYADVLSGDTIKYRIIAQDNSINHLKDSTALISFRILGDTSYVCVGSGTVSLWEGPFANFYPGFKTQMLWTAAEINANGGGGAGNITRIAFYVLRVDTTTMRNFILKMANSSLTSLTTGFVNANGATEFSGNVKITSPGWYYMNLTTPFYWDGVSSIIIETCFGNVNYVNNGGSILQGTTIPGMMYTGYRSDSLICGTAPEGVEAGNDRPNLCFTINHTVGVGNITAGIPADFNLYQNYPNPFNPVTRIIYDVPQQNLVSLKIYDLLGREILTLVNDVKRPGSYAVDFNASGLSSGIYIYRMQSGGYISVRRMVLLK